MQLKQTVRPCEGQSLTMRYSPAMKEGISDFLACHPRACPVLVNPAVEMGSGIPRLAHQGLYDSAKKDFEEGAQIHDLDPHEMEARI